MPFDNTLYSVDMTGAEIKKILEYGIKNKKIGMLQFSGIKVVYDESLPEGSRVTEIMMTDGRDFDQYKTYKVGTNDFMVAGGRWVYNV